MTPKCPQCKSLGTSLHGRCPNCGHQMFPSTVLQNRAKHRKEAEMSRPRKIRREEDDE